MAAMKKVKSYTFSLYNTSEDAFTGLLVVATVKTKNQFKKDYDTVRNDWYEEECPDSLDNYLMNRLGELGYTVSIEVFDDTADILEF